MKIALTADIHVHKWREFSSTTEKGQHDRLQDATSVLTEIGTYCKANKVEVAIVAGDLFHKRGMVDTDTFNSTFVAMQAASEDVPWFLMDGNHDQATKDGRVHSLEPFNSIDAVTVVRREGFALSDSVFVDFFPYTDDEKKTMVDLHGASVSTIKGYDNTLAIMHHGFAGAKIGSSLEYEVKEPLDPESVVAKGYDYIFSGHYHTRQHLADNLMYIGAPHEHTRHDRSEGARGFLVYDTNTRKVRVVKLKRPRFVTIEEGSDYDADAVSGNFIDLVTADDNPKDLVGTLYTLGARGVEVKAPERAVRKTSKRIDVDAASSPKDVVRAYVEWAKENGVTDLDSDALIQAGHDLLQETER